MVVRVLPSNVTLPVLLFPSELRVFLEEREYQRPLLKGYKDAASIMLGTIPFYAVYTVNFTESQPLFSAHKVV